MREIVLTAQKFAGQIRIQREDGTEKILKIRVMDKALWREYQLYRARNTPEEVKEENLSQLERLKRDVDQQDKTIESVIDQLLMLLHGATVEDFSGLSIFSLTQQLEAIVSISIGSPEKAMTPVQKKTQYAKRKQHSALQSAESPSISSGEASTG